MKKDLLKILSTAVFAFATPSLFAEETFEFAKDDVVLGFQATSGSGTTQNIFFNLGSTVSFREKTYQEVLGNIGEDLAEVYGLDWFSRADLHFGVAGNRTGLSNANDPAVGDEDPARVWYVSEATTIPGASNPRQGAQFTGSVLGGGGNNFAGMKRIFTDGENPDVPGSGFLEDRLLATPSGATILRENEQPTRWNNSWTKWNPVPGAAFLIFGGGIQNNFGKEGDRVLVDIQRIVPNTNAVIVATIAIHSDGTIRAFDPSAVGEATPFQDWVATFPALVSSPNEADRSPEGDFDKDGIPNIREFAFGGSPVSASDNGQQQLRTVDATGNLQRDLTLTVEVRSGTTFTPSGNKLTASHDGVLYTIEGSLDLVTFESAVSEVTPNLGTGTPKAGYVFKTFRLNASSGLSGKGFIRAGAAVAP